MGGYCLIDTVSVGEDEKALETDRGDGCKHCECT